FYFFFLNAAAATVTYTLPLHDALPIFAVDGLQVLARGHAVVHAAVQVSEKAAGTGEGLAHFRSVLQRGAAARHHFLGVELDQAIDRKSTRLNSSHVKISYAVFCLKKKK